MNKRGSGQLRATDHVAAFEAYLKDLRDRGERLPARPNGEVNLSQIAKDSGVGDRGRFHTNERLKQLLDGAKADAAAAPVPTVDAVQLPSAQQADSRSSSPEALQRVERRAHRLEQMNATLMSENAELRRQVKELRLQLGREDMIIETGRRVPASGAQ